MAMVWDNSARKLHGYNGAGRASFTTSLTDMQELTAAAGAPKGFMPTSGPLPVTVPGAAKGWCDLHGKFGKLPLSQVGARTRIGTLERTHVPHTHTHACTRGFLVCTQNAHIHTCTCIHVHA